MWLRALEMTAQIANHRTRVLPIVVEELATALGEAPAILSDGELLTYRELAQMSNRYARWALGQGLAKGEVVCLLMPNRGEYLAIWLGITRIGGVVSLLNTNLAGSSLAHCIDVVAPKHVIVAAELVGAFIKARPHIAGNVKVWLKGCGEHDLPRLDDAIAKVPGEKLADAELRPLSIEDRALCIYTSGTTGLPKAAHVNHYRLMYWSHWFAGLMDAQSTDRMYNCLPMYHSVGGVVATGAMLVTGGSVAIRERFSSRLFWDDIVEWDCTLFQYIGELCRYLLHSPPNPRENEHRLRLCCGNGLRPDVWRKFEERFKIPQILEFYASTEGNVSLFNCEGKPGAIGRIPPFLSHRFAAAVVKFDTRTESPVRNDDGSCIRCAANEVGETLGKISNDPSNYIAHFEGYTSEEQTERKIIRDVFEKGDAWFRTGDLMRKDEQGYFYFVDRVGDTFRWKGENVATSEVSEIITAFPGVTEATVYGVMIPGTDGRAGMAAVVFEHKPDLVAFREHLITHLPNYARPLFLRVRSELDVTATFKQLKADLVREGYDPDAVTDAVYFNDIEHQLFVQVDRALYGRIRSGQIRL